MGRGAAWRLPEAYSETRVCSLLRMCERFKIDPARVLAAQNGPHADTSGWIETLLLDYERLRQAEEARELELVLRASVAGL